MPITRIAALKRYFENLTNTEMIALKKADPEAFAWLGNEAAKELGETVVAE